MDRTAHGRRIALAALIGTAALYVAPLALTTPMASAESLATRCAKGNGTFALGTRSDGSIVASCTTTNSDGVKTQCSEINHKPQGCITVPRTAVKGTHIPNGDLVPVQVDGSGVGR
ncbi:hypothetical protein OS121_09170 [Mycolicibacterium mucogenicum]|uniref:hypothetical protein n=1 Tax=Mycolicibacterium mucogenicum TaxID=56689 RepID=UPI00226A82CF|nr:hypothetical protein [Mycolicibacterium mucogenicum]MCX8555263.1 hypothetical protein [Mycolicibacterium mucogenicum]